MPAACRDVDIVFVVLPRPKLDEFGIAGRASDGSARPSLARPANETELLEAAFGFLARELVSRVCNSAESADWHSLFLHLEAEH